MYCDAWELFDASPPALPPAGVAVRALRGVVRGDVRQFGGVLSDVLGGVELGRKVLVGGTKGVGKSTVVAELAARMGEALQGPIFWLDREMDVSQVQALFVRTNSPSHRVRWVGPDPDAPADRPARWREVLPIVGADAAVVVVDSLQRWTVSDADRTAFLGEVRRMRPTVIVISHANKQGQIAGRNEDQHDVDAVVLVKRRKLVADKCRWTPTPREVRRPNAHNVTASKKDASSS